jgi:hypothetical protein
MNSHLPESLHPSKISENLGTPPKKYARKPKGPRPGAAFLTKEEAAFELGICKRGLEHLLNAGRLAKVVLSARCIRIARAELERFARDNSTALIA